MELAYLLIVALKWSNACKQNPYAKLECQRYQDPRFCSLDEIHFVEK